MICDVIMITMPHLLRFDNLPISDGIVPAKLLPCQANFANLFSFPICVLIVPVSLLPKSRRSPKLVKLYSSCGMSPTMAFW